MKHLSSPVDVTALDETPVSFIFRGKTYAVVRVEETWVLQGNWWMAEERRSYYRVQTPDGIAVLYLREVKNQPAVWMLESMFD